MKLFSSENLNYLGVDIGKAGIKVVEFKNENGRPRLVTYGYVNEAIDMDYEISKEQEQENINLLKQILEKARVTTNKVVVGIPSFSVFSSVISLPLMNKKDLAQAVYWQAKKIVPIPLEEMTLDWKILNNVELAVNKKNKDKKNVEKNGSHTKLSKSDHVARKDLKILVAAAPKKLVLKYVELFKQANLELISLETENFALERALVGGDKNPVMIVDIGSATADISIVENGIPVLSRSVDTGGKAITKAIMNSMRIDEKRAEQFKKDVGFSNKQGNLPKVIEESIAPIINEIKYGFDLYVSRQSQLRIEKIILTGGSSFLPNMPEYLSKLLNITVFIGDPWAKVIYPLELKSVLDNLAPRFSVAVGLAMREIV